MNQPWRTLDGGAGIGKSGGRGGVDGMQFRPRARGDEASRVEHHVAAGKRVLPAVRCRERADDELGPRRRQRLRSVARSHKAADRAAPIEESADEMASDESGRTGDENAAHRTPHGPRGCPAAGRRPPRVRQGCFGTPPAANRGRPASGQRKNAAGSGYSYGAGENTAAQSRFMSTTVQPRWLASASASTSRPVPGGFAS